MFPIKSKIIAPFKCLTEQICTIISPPICETCNAPLHDHQEILCVSCLTNFNETVAVDYCPTCAMNVGMYGLIDEKCHLCQGKKPYITHATRVGPYRGSLKSLLIKLKFNKQTRLDRYLGQHLASALLATDHVDLIDYLIPIPLHWQRYLQRGYNQSELIAQETHYELAKCGLKIPIRKDLVRTQNTPPQMHLSRNERLNNLKNAFALRKDAPFKGKHICIIDDVTTTGATLHVAARLLKKAGAKTVSMAVIAVTPSPNESLTL